MLDNQKTSLFKIICKSKDWKMKTNNQKLLILKRNKEDYSIDANLVFLSANELLKYQRRLI